MLQLSGNEFTELVFWMQERCLAARFFGCHNMAKSVLGKNHGSQGVQAFQQNRRGRVEDFVANHVNAVVPGGADFLPARTLANHVRPRAIARSRPGQEDDFEIAGEAGADR